MAISELRNGHGPRPYAALRLGLASGHCKGSEHIVFLSSQIVLLRPFNPSALPCPLTALWFASCPTESLYSSDPHAAVNLNTCCPNPGGLMESKSKQDAALAWWYSRLPPGATAKLASWIPK